MRIDISVNEFADRIRKFDSCDLDYSQACALGEWIEEDSDDPSWTVCVGDWAILSSFYTFDELVERAHEHGATHVDAESVLDVDTDDVDCWALIRVDDGFVVVER